MSRQLEQRRPAALGASLVVGPLAWAAHVVGMWALAGPACSRDLAWVLHAGSALAAIAVAWAVAVSARALRREAPRRGGGAEPPTRNWVVGIVALGLNALLLVGVITVWLQALLVDACA